MKHTGTRLSFSPTILGDWKNYGISQDNYIGQWTESRLQVCFSLQESNSIETELVCRPIQITIQWRKLILITECCENQFAGLGLRISIGTQLLISFSPPSTAKPRRWTPPTRESATLRRVPHPIPRHLDDVQEGRGIILDRGRSRPIQRHERLGKIERQREALYLTCVGLLCCKWRNRQWKPCEYNLHWSYNFCQNHW